MTDFAPRGLVSVGLVADQAAEAKWAELIKHHPQATYAHRLEWVEIFRKAYSLNSAFCVAEYEGRVVALLPAVAISKCIGRKKRLVSVPFCDYGDILAISNCDLSELRSLMTNYLSGLGYDSIEIRSRSNDAEKSARVCMVLKLEGPSQAIWEKLSGNTRRKVRKAIKNGLEPSWGKHHLDGFYKLYLKAMKRLGTPPHSHKFFQEILQNFKGDADILAIAYKGEIKSATLVIRQGEALYTPYIASDSAYHYLYTNMLLYWEVISAGSDAGLAYVDFGRCLRDSGVFKFKAQWGCGAVPLNYYLAGTTNKGVSTDLYDRGLARGLAALWSRFPLPLQRWLGPSLRKRLP